MRAVLDSELARLGHRDRVAYVLTHSVVDAADPAFANPTKPIGPFYSAHQATTKHKRNGWQMIEDSGRGYRRVEWIERALEPMRDTLSPERFERLVPALTLFIGWESMIVLQDLRGLTAAEAEEVCVWAAATLLAAERD